MIDLDPPGGSSVGNPPDKNPRSPRPDDGTFPVESVPTGDRKPGRLSVNPSVVPMKGRPPWHRFPALVVPKTGQSPQSQCQPAIVPQA